MKTTSKLIASLSLSLLTIGGFAQTMTNIPITNSTQHALSTPFNLSSHKVLAGSPTTYAFLDYPFSDSLAANNEGEGYSGDPSILSGLYIQTMNMHYIPKDTGVHKDSNNLLITQCAVAFDSLLDASTGNSYYTNKGVTVDTIYVLVGQQNVSGKNDTLVISINTLGAHNIPTSTVLWSTTIIQDTGLSGKGKYWNHLHMIMLEPNITVPGTGKFAITMQYYSENKKDSMGFLYCFPTWPCSTPAGNLPDTSFIGTTIPVTGPPKGKLTANSFTTGYVYFMSGHKGTPIQLPSTAYGDFIGYTCTSPSQFSAGPFQDIIMLANVSFVNTLGVNNITTSGLSVNQNYPNPFNKTTQITYNLVKSADVVFSVSDITGRELVNNVYNSVEPGQHAINLNANTFAPGIYFYTFKVNGNEVTKKMVITE